MADPATGYASTWRRRASSMSTAPHLGYDNADLANAIPSDSTAPIAQLDRLSSSIGAIPSSLNQREPIPPIDSAQNARSVRDDTAELASYLLSDRPPQHSPSFLGRKRWSSESPLPDGGSPSGQGRKRWSAESPFPDAAHGTAVDGSIRGANTIQEVSEPSSPENGRDTAAAIDDEGPSVLANLLRKSPSEEQTSGSPLPRRSRTQEPFDRSGDDDDDDGQGPGVVSPPPSWLRRGKLPDSALPEGEDPSENTPLLIRQSPTGEVPGLDTEAQKLVPCKKWFSGLVDSVHSVERGTTGAWPLVVNPKRWDSKAIWENLVVAPASCMPAVCVGLLLNILDALSYGMILFPLSKPIFAHLGSAGISIFYVSTIISQLTFSSGSIFKGAVGSELITDLVGKENGDAVIATTVVSYSLSAMLTGLVFYLMGKFKFGFMVGFIPRHILIGCIGGVGWFLVATGFEVSARLEGSIQYDLDTLHKLTRPEALPRWILPLVLAVVLFYGQSKFTSKYFLPMYILAIPAVFYFFVLSLDVLDPDSLRDSGWIFDGPPAGEPWWYFYTLFKFHLVRWDAVAECIPAMFALTFFGILHVPINVPALALQSGEDNADLDSELRLHGFSNFMSGCLGSIQNYLVYANTAFFMRSGGDKRLAGFLLALLTLGVMTIGPSLIGFIPVMMVGTLIFDLGFELLLEAVWLPRKKLKVAEYVTVIIIVLVMGIYDFVIGIGVGILLAFVSLIVQTSRVSAIRGTFTGETVSSTVRRNPSQHRYLQQVGSQIYMLKLTGYLFFGTIVSVEEKIRSVLEHDAFTANPIKFLILDLWNVSGLDYSAGEVFNTISRLLDKKGIVFVLSGVDTDSQMGRNLRAVGLGSSGVDVTMLPDLNSALESCENELLKILYMRQQEMYATKRTSGSTVGGLDVPAAKRSSFSSFDPPFNSPRRTHLVEAASDALQTDEVQRTTKWQSFKEPLRLMLQIFQGLSDKNEDFWFPATNYFSNVNLAPGTVLFQRGDEANGFYLVERGILRVEYDLPQGWLCESIMAGTTCGELPFFSDTERTATASAERECVVWRMDRNMWSRMQREEPEIAGELLRVSLKLTSERMGAITSYVMTMAG
ncbi:sulfate permease, SulP family [Geosmithia morbida]|uniref:Sulfate permease, SulP family n=1 Tax=Geosmithia morbida TaxID=1094350 RepID=A0A9P4YX39_9HYPO|nr:sulfate permease, SulP family [Geosmithia morbida]KAF4123384.1 sulfate permease, SulP family [Geosmithia morbida]